VEGTRESIAYLTGAIRAGSTLPEDFLLLAGAHGQSKRHAEAIRVLRKGLEQNPYLHEFYDALAAQYVALEEYRDALQLTRKGLDVFPDDTALLMLQKKVQAAMLDTVR
jgi:tetratricopeptide (TPR) repeat protein